MTDRGRALLIHQAAIGDFLIALRICPLVAADVPLDWTYAGKESLGRLARALGAITAYHDVESGTWHRLFVDHPADTAELSNFLKSFGVIVNMLAGPEATVSRNLETLSGGRVFHVDPKPPEGYDGHCRQYHAGQIGIGPDALPAPGPFAVTDECLRTAERFAQQADLDIDRLALIHPGASGARKRWPVEYFLVLADRLRGAGYDPAFLAGPVELEQFADEQMQAISRCGPVLADLPLETVAGLLALAGRYVGNDNGISHLSGAVGARTAVVFVGTDPTMWGPLGPQVWAVRTDSGATRSQICDRLVQFIRGTHP